VNPDGENQHKYEGQQDQEERSHAEQNLAAGRR
jgi:hypothetical protein